MFRIHITPDFLAEKPISDSGQFEEWRESEFIDYFPRYDSVSLEISEAAAEWLLDMMTDVKAMAEKRGDYSLQIETMSAPAYLDVDVDEFHHLDSFRPYSHIAMFELFSKERGPTVRFAVRDKHSDNRIVSREFTETEIRDIALSVP